MKLPKTFLAIALCLAAATSIFASVPSSTTWVQYTLTTNPQTLTVPFVFQSASDLLVLDSKASPPVALVLNSDYSVSGGSGSTGTITTIAGGSNAVAAGDRITISRRVPLTQTTTFTTGGPITPAIIGQSVDKLTTIAQQLNLVGANSLQFQGDEQLSGVLPLNSRKGAFLAFDSNGVPWFPTSATIVTSLANPISVVSIAALKLLPVAGFGTGVPCQVLGYYSANDGGGGTYVWNSSSTATDNGGTVIQATGVATGRWLYVPNGPISVKVFGAKGDFSGSSGTDDRAAIQNTLAYAATITTGATVWLPPGGYYLGSNYATGAYQLNLDSATNVEIRGYGATMYPGAAGSMLGITNSKNCVVNGIKAIGYCGGTIDSSREHDNLIAFASSTFVTVKDCYFTNCLGDDVYVGGAGTVQHVKLVNNTFKERYGNGTRSSSGGTRSRLCVAVIDAYDVLIANNQIIGGVDFENNFASQNLKAIEVVGNNFTSGHVTPQNPIGTAYWFDEAIAVSGGTTVDQGIQFSGPSFTTAPQYSAAIVADNFFESVTIFFNSQVYRLLVKNNHFAAGLINVGDTSGSNTNANYVIDNNTFDAPLAGQTCVVKFGGTFTNGRFSNNIAAVDSGYVFGLVAGGAGVGGYDGRSNFFANNVNTSTNSPLGVLSWSYNRLSVYVNNWCYVGGGVTERAQSNTVQILKRSGGSWPTVTVTSAAQALDYNTLTSDNFILASDNTGTHTLGSIANAPDGAEITIEADAPGITIVNSGSIRLTGGVNAVATDANSIIVLVARAGLLWEKCRNF